MKGFYLALYEGGLGEAIADGIILRLIDGFAWIGNKIIEGLGTGLIGLTPIFAGTCIIGVFLSIAGERKLGTKISSLSIVIYFLLKVILHA